MFAVLHSNINYFKSGFLQFKPAGLIVKSVDQQKSETKLEIKVLRTISLINTVKNMLAYYTN